MSLHWWFIIPIAGLWQIYHTEQQRYGMLRIYARKAGYGSARLDRAVLYVPFLLALGAVALLPSTRDQLRRFGAKLGGPNVENINTLLSPAASIVAATVPVALAALVVLGPLRPPGARGRARRHANPAKWHYLVGTGALTAGLAFDPAAGLIAFVAAHALEYVVVVDRTLRSRYASAPAEGRPASLLAVLAGSRNRRIALLVGFFAVFAVVDLQLRGVLAANVYLVVVYTIGLLHFLYDGFIWKTRRPSVAADFGVKPARLTAVSRSTSAQRSSLLRFVRFAGQGELPFRGVSVGTMTGVSGGAARTRARAAARGNVLRRLQQRTRRCHRPGQCPSRRRPGGGRDRRRTRRPRSALMLTLRSQVAADQ